MHIWNTLKRSLELYPERCAVSDGPVSLTYRQVGERVAALARFLAGRGLAPGDRMSILDWNSHAYLETYYAAALAGAVLNPLNVRLSAREIAFILRDAGSRLLVAREGFAPLVREVLALGPGLEGVLWVRDAGARTERPREADPGRPAHVLPPDVASFRYEDVVAQGGDLPPPAPAAADAVAHLYYTSGTTGRAKGVMLTHGNVCLHALGTIAELRLAATDAWGHFAPMFHLADAWATFALSWVGGRHVMRPRFEPVDAMETIQRERVTLTNLIPAMLNLMVKNPRARQFHYGSLRCILSGGAPIAPALVRDVMRTFGCEYIQTYGMTETCPYLTLSILKEQLKALPEEEQMRYRSRTGRPFIGVDLEVVDPRDRPVRADDAQVGEIRVRGDTVTPGYWNLPQETARAIRGGWLYTGDLATLDREGYVNIVDRKKDMIVTGGENVFSIEVENVLAEHPGVLETAVFGVPHETWGEAVHAAVVLREGAAATAEEIIGFCKARLASYKAPKSVAFLEALPRTGSGKIFKKALREAFDGPGRAG